MLNKSPGISKNVNFVSLILIHVVQVKEKSSKPHVEVKVNDADTLFAPEEISAMVLTKMKEVAEAYLGKTVS